jgi:Uma2 family endonuclease
MSIIAPRLATYDDLLALPGHVVGEIIRGVLHSHPRPAPRHARAYSRLGAELDGPYDQGRGGPGGWWILDEPELHLSGNVLVPDLAGWRRSRMPRLPDTAWFELAPDWVCEVLSPSTARLDRVEKMPLYAQEGIGHCWLIDPDLRTLEAYRNHDSKWLLLGALQDGAGVCLPPFDATTFALSGLWAD